MILLDRLEVFIISPSHVFFSSVFSYRIFKIGCQLFWPSYLRHRTNMWPCVIGTVAYIIENYGFVLPSSHPTQKADVTAQKTRIRLPVSLLRNFS